MMPCKVEGVLSLALLLIKLYLFFVFISIVIPLLFLLLLFLCTNNNNMLWSIAEPVITSMAAIPLYVWLPAACTTLVIGKEIEARCEQEKRERLFVQHHSQYYDAVLNARLLPAEQMMALEFSVGSGEAISVFRKQFVLLDATAMRLFLLARCEGLDLDVVKVIARFIYRELGELLIDHATVVDYLAHRNKEGHDPDLKNTTRKWVQRNEFFIRF